MKIFSGAIDQGLEGVVACTTKISSIVGSTLCYRGYTIEDLAENSTFEEVIFLLWNDRLPSQSELKAHRQTLEEQMFFTEDELSFLKKIPVQNVHPMAWLRTAFSAISLWDPLSQSRDKQDQKQVGIRATAKMGPLLALFERLRQGQEYIPPQEGRSQAWNFLYMLKGIEPEELEVQTLDTCFILHADHELNCSAFSARVTVSSLSDIYSAVTSAIGTLKGSLHGGANEQVMLTLKKIGDKNSAQDWVEKALARKEKIMGFGHRVYKEGDPRAKVLKKMSRSLTQKKEMFQWFEMSEIIENFVKKEKGLLPNVDFYSATVYYALGIPMDLYTPIFVVSRTGGWLAHIYEQYAHNRIYRPRGKWAGRSSMKWKPVEER